MTAILVIGAFLALSIVRSVEAYRNGDSFYEASLVVSGFQAGMFVAAVINYLIVIGVNS